MDSQLQYYVPERFWKVFKLWGQTVNIREQQDAFDFYTSLVDQLDEQLKVCGGNDQEATTDRNLKLVSWCTWFYGMRMVAF